VGRTRSPAQLRRWLEPVAAEFGLGDCELAHAGVDEAEGAALNAPLARARDGHQRIVISRGHYARDGTQPRHLGDLVLCAPVLRREAAAEQGQARASPLGAPAGAWHPAPAGPMTTRLRRKPDEMEALEARLLAALNIDPYAQADGAVAAG
jgi:hypothetical protein